MKALSLQLDQITLQFPKLAGRDGLASDCQHSHRLSHLYRIIICRLDGSDFRRNPRHFLVPRRRPKRQRLFAKSWRAREAYSRHFPCAGHHVGTGKDSGGGHPRPDDVAHGCMADDRSDGWPYTAATWRMGGNDGKQIYFMASTTVPTSPVSRPIPRGIRSSISMARP